MLYSILLTVDVLLAIGLIVLVLLQHGKGADAGAAFGSGASATVFGSRGSASFLTRSTAAFATLFFINSLGLAYLVSHRPADSSVIEQMADQPATSPATAPSKKGDNAAALPQPSGDVPADDVPTPGANAPAREQPSANGTLPRDVPR